MPIPQEGSLPAFFTLNEGMRVRMTAIDAVTGAVVAGVKVSNASIDVDDVGAPIEPSPETPGPIFLIPGPALQV